MIAMPGSYDLRGQVAIITGASRGIGATCAYMLARNGAHVVIVDLLPADEIMNKIKADFPDCETMPQQIDIRKRAEVEQVIHEVISKWGRIDILVNNAGTCTRKGLHEITDEEWSLDLNTNLGGTFLFTQLTIYPHMKDQGYGKVVNMSSISGINGGVSSHSDGTDSGRSGPAYAASKGAVIAFSKWVAKEVGRYGICCNSVAPGVVKTEMTKEMNYPLENQAIKRPGTVDDIAEAVVYLASPASNYITGQVMRVCGGHVIA